MLNISHLDGRYVYPAPAVYTPGQVVVRPCGTLAVFDGLQSNTSGQPISPQPLRPTLICDVSKKSADTFSAGDNVYYDVAEQEATSTSESNTYLGKATRDYAGGTTVMEVNMDSVGSETEYV